MLRFLVTATLVSLALAAPASLDQGQKVSLSLTYFEDVKSLLKKGYGFSKISIDTKTNRIAAILEVEQPEVESLKKDLGEKSITFESQPSKRDHLRYLISTNLVTKIVANLERRFFVDVHLKSIEETADIFSKYSKVAEVTFVQIAVSDDEKEEKITLMVKENSLNSVLDYLEDKGMKFEVLANKPDWIDCAPDAFDQFFMHRKRTYVTGVVSSKDEKKIGEFVERFGNSNDLQILNVTASVANAKATVRVERHMWENVEKYLQEGGFDFVLDYVGEKKC